MQNVAKWPLLQLHRWLATELEKIPSKEILEFTAANPDNSVGLYTGELTANKNVHRGVAFWVDLASKMNCRLLAPIITNPNEIVVRFQKLDLKNSWHGDLKSQKYDSEAEYARIQKFEQPDFFSDFKSAIDLIELPEKTRILFLGSNRGDEIIGFQKIVGLEKFDEFEIVGVDISESAIEYARSNINLENVTFNCADINKFVEQEMEKFDLALAISVLHSPEIDHENVLRRLVQNVVNEKCGLIFAFPNCRYVDGEVRYGAKLKNFSEPELSLLIKDVAFFKKYLQQHKFSVRILGKNYVFVVGKR